LKVESEFFTIKSFIKPFERELALKELSALVGDELRPMNGSRETATKFIAPLSADVGLLNRSLAYWYAAGAENDYTNQLRREATSLVARNGIAVDEIASKVQSLILDKLPNSRCLRYATHGLHEYRGKFFPQLVKSLINIAQVPSDGVVLDPMCGSGTTLVEAKLSGRNAIGVDMNPLSVFLTSVKCSSLELQADVLVSSFNSLKRVLDRASTAGKQGYSLSLSENDQRYLDRWFAASALSELDTITAAINEIADERVRDFFRVSQSNIIRWASLQKEADLRVRREEKDFEKGEILGRFLEEALRATKLVAAFLAENFGQSTGGYSVLEGDARAMDALFPHYSGQVDAIVTSPPYATALPYLDTDRLSLIYLGLLPRADHRERDLGMIGNREVTERQRREAWEYYEANKGLLPRSAQELIDKIERLNSGSSVGFRRKNLASLLAKYFFDMRSVLVSSQTMMRDGGTIFMVVGNNRTTAGNVDVKIQTANLLIDIGREIGLEFIENLPMDMLVSRDIFRDNAMASEQIFSFKKI
jgi:hypothetical protein